jgi:threonyl-tRNA synthetase
MYSSSTMETSIEHKRHTLAHLLALAVRRDFPHALPTIGPAIENGFYYDFDFSHGAAPTDAEVKQIEKNMKKALSSWKEFSHRVVTPDEAREVFKGNQYKTELINELEKNGETITLYTVGEGHFEFTDLCRGGHSESPATDIDPDSFKLTTLAGAYWRGNEKNQMLTRIYGLAFNTKEELDAHLEQIEEAKKRDHRKIGQEMRLFTISSLIGSGLPLLQPRGAIIRQEIEEYLWYLHKSKGYERVWTPHIAKESLYETSGHAEKFGDELFRVSGKDERFILKPMNCPHHMQIFADNQFSYRDMPIRYFEPATVYRDEKTGQLAGLTRVRSITQDDGHLFCRVTQIDTEVTTIVGIIREFYRTMNLLEGYWVRLSVRGEGGQYIGNDDVWERAEQALEDSAKKQSLPYKRVEGEAAFYGPKLDFMFKDAIGREWQLATIQCDFNLPERFDLSFINEAGKKERPVVIHRAISGSLERFMGVMIEHFGGNFPLWLSPEQIRIIPVAETHAAYAAQIHDELKAIGIRATLDDSNESLGKRIRNAKTDRLPYFAVVGEKEVEAKNVTLESRSGTSVQMTLSALGNHLMTEIETKAL